MIRMYAAGAALAAVLAMLGAIWWQGALIDALRADKAALELNILALEAVAAQEAEAREANRERLRFLEQKEAAYNELRDNIGEGPDAHDQASDTVLGAFK